MMGSGNESNNAKRVAPTPSTSRLSDGEVGGLDCTFGRSAPVSRHYAKIRSYRTYEKPRKTHFTYLRDQSRIARCQEELILWSTDESLRVHQRAQRSSRTNFSIWLSSSQLTSELISLGACIACSGVMRSASESSSRIGFFNRVSASKLVPKQVRSAVNVVKSLYLRMPK